MSRKLLGDYAALLGGLLSLIKWYYKRKEQFYTSTVLDKKNVMTSGEE